MGTLPSYSYNPNYYSDDSYSQPQQPQPQPQPQPTQSQIASEVTNKERRNLDYALGFVPEFQEAILVLHIATDIFFLQSCSSNNELLLPDREPEGYKKVIQVVSNYMALLAAARPEMVPGLKLRSLYSMTRDSLVKIIRDEMEKAENQHDGEMGKNKKKPTQRGSSSLTKHNLALLLQDMEREKDNPKKGRYTFRSKLYRQSGTLSDGIVLAKVLLARLHENWRTSTKEIMKKTRYTSRNRIMFLLRLADTEASETFGMDAVLKQILVMWVGVLIFVSTRCGIDSHARQLARGCELTTIVWILVEHAKIFRI